MQVMDRLSLAAYGMHVADQIALVTVPLVAALAFQASPETIGVLVACQAMAHLLGSIPAGLCVDRVQARTVTIAATAVSLVGFSAAALSVVMESVSFFAVTVLLSLYLAGTIARPVKKLAEAATLVRDGGNRQHAIPDLSKRKDEIGALSSALRDMTDGLWLRMDATEQFAADVSHEIKNPLTSLRSAVETVARIEDPEQQKQLVGIIKDDVSRLDRLISDISDASRLDAELSRAETETVSLTTLLETLADITNSDGKPGAPRVVIDLARDDDLKITGLEGRIAQVFRNLIGNAASFSPAGGKIFIRAHRDGGDGKSICVEVEDQGPGIPKGKEDAIFSRFYSERPEAEKFGTHSGLGLSISKQIVEAHHGRISASNADSGGACFSVRFPAL